MSKKTAAAFALSIAQLFAAACERHHVADLAKIEHGEDGREAADAETSPEQNAPEAAASPAAAPRYFSR